MVFHKEKNKFRFVIKWILVKTRIELILKQALNGSKLLRGCKKNMSIDAIIWGHVLVSIVEEENTVSFNKALYVMH